MRGDPQENILGVGVHALEPSSAVAKIFGFIEARKRTYVCVTGVHGIMESWRSAELRRVHNDAGMVTPDGMPLAWILRLRGHAEARQVCGPDLMPLIFASGQRMGCRHFLYGASSDTLHRLEQRLLRAAPDARIVGKYAPPYRPANMYEDAKILADINASGADIVWVGLSTPKQEFWMASHRHLLAAPVLIGVGAAFDINAGLRRRAPRIVSKLGFEWAFRLLQEPRRLAGRYLRNNPVFLGMIMLQAIGLMQFPLEKEPIHDTQA